MKYLRLTVPSIKCKCKSSKNEQKKTKKKRIQMLKFKTRSTLCEIAIRESRYNEFREFFYIKDSKQNPFKTYKLSPTPPKQNFSKSFSHRARCSSKSNESFFFLLLRSLPPRLSTFIVLSRKKTNFVFNSRKLLHLQ